MKNWIQRNKLYLLGALVGGIAGFAYWYFIGCWSGTCAITSSPINSTAYFAVLGAMIFGIFKNPQNVQKRS